MYRYRLSRCFGDPLANIILLQPVSDRDLPMLEEENARIRLLTGRRDYLLAAVRVSNWNDDLSPWKAPPLFSSLPYGGGGEETLQAIQKEIFSLVLNGRSPKGLQICLGGYSLAGLFALWSGCRTFAFSGIAAASPALWYPGMQEFLEEHHMRPRKVYLSMGEREVQQFGLPASILEETQELLRLQGIDCETEWNPGNHFRDPALRMARAFAWLLNRL